MQIYTQCPHLNSWVSSELYRMPPRKAKLQFIDHDMAAGIIKDDEENRFAEIHELDLNKIHPLNADDIERGVRITIIGRPGSGKSRVIEHIMLYKAHISPVTQVFSGTENVNHFYAQRTPDITVFNELNLKAMEETAKRQSIATKYLPNPWIMQILDDVTDDPYVLKKHPFGPYYRKLRHWRMIHINAAQYAMDVPAGLRSCIDYVFIMANPIPTEREKIYENFAKSAIPTFQDFCDLMDELTQDMTALVIDNISQSPQISDRVFYFRANLDRVPPNFRVGCRETYAFDEDRRDPNFLESYL